MWDEIKEGSTVEKYELIDQLIVRVNKLADAHGVARCMGIIQAIQDLDELKKILQAEDAARAEAKEDAPNENA